MNKFKKALALICCAVLLVCISVGATLAYLSANTPEVVNTFTTGDIKMTLDEALVDEYGNLLDKEGKIYEGKDGQELADRVYKNDYKLLPGHEYVKDPTVTILEDSEDCYVRVFVEVSNIEALKKAFPATDENGKETEFAKFYDENGLFLLQELVGGWTAANWQCVKYHPATAEAGATYEFWYVGSKAPEGDGIVPLNANADTVLEPLFTSVIIPGTIENDALAKLKGVEINIYGQAIQSDGFANAEEAWEKAPVPTPVAAPVEGGNE